MIRVPNPGDWETFWNGGGCHFSPCEFNEELIEEFGGRYAWHYQGVHPSLDGDRGRVLGLYYTDLSVEFIRIDHRGMRTTTLFERTFDLAWQKKA